MHSLAAKVAEMPAEGMLACPPDFMSIELVMGVFDYKGTMERWVKVSVTGVNFINRV